MLLSPIFFASIGIEVSLHEMSGRLILFAVALTLVAAVGKVLGCGAGAKFSGYETGEALQIGFGMITRARSH
jgi:Kef-type K+ transport system membrane component KefB